MNFETIKTMIAAIIIELLAYFQPIGHDVAVLLMIFAANFFCGLIEDIIVEDKTFQFKKAWKCVVELATFFVMSVFIFMYGRLKSWNVGAEQSVSFLIYIISWFYCQNILRNLKSIFPKNTPSHSVITFLYYVVSVEFVKKLPFLSEWAANREIEEQKEKERIEIEEQLKIKRRNRKKSEESDSE